MSARVVCAGLTSVIASWVVSPILSMVVVAILYGLIRTFVLRSPNSFKRAYYVRPA
jgi:sodium-dependent phosphate transporter